MALEPEYTAQTRSLTSLADNVGHGYTTACYPVSPPHPTSSMTSLTSVISQRRVLFPGSPLQGRPFPNSPSSHWWLGFMSTFRPSPPTQAPAEDSRLSTDGLLLFHNPLLSFPLPHPKSLWTLFPCQVNQSPFFFKESSPLQMVRKTLLSSLATNFLQRENTVSYRIDKFVPPLFTL